jgi:hypothetical protein
MIVPPAKPSEADGPLVAIAMATFEPDRALSPSGDRLDQEQTRQLDLPDQR